MLATKISRIWCRLKRNTQIHICLYSKICLILKSRWNKKKTQTLLNLSNLCCTSVVASILYKKKPKNFTISATTAVNMQYLPTQTKHTSIRIWGEYLQKLKDFILSRFFKCQRACFSLNAFGYVFPYTQTLWGFSSRDIWLKVEIDYARIYCMGAYIPFSIQ